MSHAKINSAIYPPRDAMRQRILKKIAEGKIRRELEAGCREEVKDEVGGQSFTVQMCYTGKAENQVLKTSTRASTNVAREEFNQAMLAKAAKAREEACLNSVGPIGKVSKKGGQEEGESSKGCGHGMGYDHRLVATSSIPERDAILRLLAS